MSIIGISGRMGSGKNTVGDIIEKLCLTNNGPKFEQKSFAGKLKQIASLLTGIPVEDFEDQEFKKSYLGAEWGTVELNPLNSIPVFENIEFNHLMSVREFLQKLGTDAMRDGLHKEVWVNALFSDVDRKITIKEEKRLKSIWKNINTRCTNSNYKKYHRYGGAGIVNEFKDFNDFVNWSLLNGYTDELTLDRKDGKLNYNKLNCRWVTVDLQSFNKLKYTNSKSNHKGVSKTKVNNKNPYIAQIQFKRKKENLGYFKTEEEAKIAYDKRYLEILKILEEENNQKLYSHKNIIITDMRFINEMEAVKERKGITIRVVRPVEKSKTTARLHPSETSLDKAKFDYEIINDAGIPELIEKVRQILITEKII